MFQEYPKALYGAGDAVSVARDAEHEDELRAQGFVSVDEAAEPVEVDDDPEQDDPNERAALIAEAEALGITLDGRWGDKRIAAEIEKVKAPQ